VNRGFVAAVDPVALYRIRTTTKLNSIEDMSCSDLVARYGTAIGRAESRIRDKRDPKLSIAHRVSGNCHSFFCIFVGQCFSPAVFLFRSHLMLISIGE